MAPGRYGDAHRLTLETDTVTVVYLAPRTLPMAPTTASLAEVRAEDVHRLDLIASRLLGDPLLAWRVADANNAMDPFDLCATAGTVLAVPASGL